MISLADLNKQKTKLKPAETKETTMLDALSKMGVASGFSDTEDSTEYFETPTEFREKVGVDVSLSCLKV
jgi:hypothetical protein